MPSFIVRVGDDIEVREGSRKRTFFKQLRELAGERPAPEWLDRDLASLSGTMVRDPERTDIDMTINEQLIVEYYSR